MAVVKDRCVQHCSLGCGASAGAALHGGHSTCEVAPVAGGVSSVHILRPQLVQAWCVTGGERSLHRPSQHIYEGCLLPAGETSTGRGWSICSSS